MARARGTPRDANPYRNGQHGPGTMSITRRLTAEEQLAMRLETAWRIGWETVDRELSNGPASAADSRRRAARPEGGSGGR